MIRISGLACFWVVVLRLAIGWHFLTEGVHKIQSHREGKTSVNTPWTGAGFFREGIGPAAPYAREFLHLDDQEALTRLKADNQRLPAPISADWDDYFNRFASHYDLSEAQKLEAAARLNDAKEKARKWLVGEVPTEVKKVVAWGVETVQQTVPMRLAEYDAKVNEATDALARRLPTFNADVEKARLRALKADASKQLSDLLGELDAGAGEMKKSLAEVLTPEQKEKGPVPDSPGEKSIDILDAATMWGHAVLGGCLLLGLFTRLSSFLLAMFLLAVTLIAPALPYAPAPPGTIGFYLFVNLYVIEMLALLALAAMPTGRWFGLDALVYYFTRGSNKPLAAVRETHSPKRLRQRIPDGA
jgi:uncharacterized membrane protein YphA (DoxX/SURF4 family)